MNNQNKMSNKMLVPGAKQAIERMKYEIANEFGVNLGPDATSRANGSVGGEITKRLVRLGQNQISGSNYNQSK
ncbi:MAG: alpha/beta-type small acid-soluble spore protein [Bacilli bacterium]|nr:alpha/beta-type small acid-soluble spore protein [Bacilli bacterium]